MDERAVNEVMEEPLETSDRSTPHIVIEAVPDPLGVADLIRECVERCRVAKGVREFN